MQMEVLKKIRFAIEEGHPQEMCDLIEEGLEAGIDPSRLIEDGMMPVMRSIGEEFRDGRCDIPHILVAARCVRKGYEVLEEKCQEFTRQKIGTVILGTVEGDLHDVGKNLVAIMFRSVGFEVIDLGVDVSDKMFLKAIQKHPDVSFVCVSALLSTALPEMSKIVKALRKNPKRKYIIMVGGGAVTEEAAKKMGADAYTENAVEAAEFAKNLNRRK